MAGPKDRTERARRADNAKVRRIERDKGRPLKSRDRAESMETPKGGKRAGAGRPKLPLGVKQASAIGACGAYRTEHTQGAAA